MVVGVLPLKVEISDPTHSETESWIGYKRCTTLSLSPALDFGLLYLLKLSLFGKDFYSLLV